MILGGLFWTAKAAMILVLGYQPPFLFEGAQLLFALGLFGLYLRVDGHTSRVGRAGMISAGFAFLARLAASLYEVLPGTEISTSEEFVFPYSFLVLIGALGLVFGLLFLGIATLRTNALVFPWRAVPLSVVALGLPLWVTSIIHIEIPILLLGMLWTLLGYTIWKQAASTPGITSAVKESR
jgi:hypothetical protein